MKIKRNLIFLSVIISVVFSGGCKKDEPSKSTPENPYDLLEIPAHFARPVIPEDNIPTRDRIALGKKLFFDPILSRDMKISCASCHHPDKSFSDGLAKSDGIEGRKAARNSMHLANIAYSPSMFWDGGIPSLERQVLGPIENVNEMDFTVVGVIERLKAHSEYPALFQKAYGKEITVETFTGAIASYERTLNSGDTPYDRYITGVDTNAMTPEQKMGMKIYFSEDAECFHCHTGNLFTDFTFQNNGLYEKYADDGRFLITGKERDRALFKVPSLRNVALTAPYMHDGSIATLEDVIDHYRSGGKNHPNKNPSIQKIKLTEQQKTYLIAFLQSLTDENFIKKHKE